MITKDGQCYSEKGGITGQEVADIIKSAQESLLASLSSVIAANAKTQVVVGYNGHMFASEKEDSSVSLADIAKAMARNSNVEGTNIGDIGSLGKEKKIEEDGGDADKTIDLLGDIP